MPRPKRNYTNRKQESILKKDDSMNSTIMSMSSKILDNNHLKLEMWKAEVKDRMKLALKKLSDMQKEKMEMIDYEFKNSLMAIPKNILDTVIDIDNETFRTTILGIQNFVNEEGPTQSPSPVAQNTVKRRSRSATNVKFSVRASSRIQRLRSTSADAFKTPAGKVRLSSIMSSKKYTVSKPRKEENSGLQVKRIMKPDEEAISTCGSPLYVASCNMGAPHVNIPLPGGVVLNIEPKLPKGPLEVPGLDAKTKSQIKMLCEQLKKLL